MRQLGEMEEGKRKRSETKKRAVKCRKRGRRRNIGGEKETEKGK